MSLYEAIAQTRGGQRHLAKARLRYRVLALLHDALSQSGLNQSELAEQAEVGKSAVSQAFAGNGNLRIDTIAAYLDAMGFELGLSLEKSGSARAKATDWVSGPVIHAELTPTVATRPLLEASAFGPTESFCLNLNAAAPAFVGMAR
jgi:DNA-binding phage protein